MATDYSDVYTIFLSKITDYSFASLAESALDDILLDYLKSAIVRFTKYSNTDLTYDDTDEAFDETLSEMEKEILATMMVVAWLTPIINSTEVLKQILNDKDFRIYSQANHLKEIKELKKDNEEEIDRLIIDYTYNLDSIEELNENLYHLEFVLILL